MSTRDKLLQSLERPGAASVSGQVLADELGITRTMVWKHMRALKELGLPIRSEGRHGYRVLSPLDFSLLKLRLPEPLRQWLTPHHYWTTHSTQLLARSGAESGLPEGH